MSVFEQQCISLFLLHALGNIIGFKYITWRMNYEKDVTLGTINEMVYDFIDIGGINGIDINNWIGSEGLLYHLAIAKTMLDYKKFNKKFLLATKQYLVDSHNTMIDEKNDNNIIRYSINNYIGYYIQQFTENIDASTLKYGKYTFSASNAVMNMCIGLVFKNEKQLDELIKVSIGVSKLTQNSPCGYLAGFTSAYFVSLAIQEIPIEKWVFMLVELLDSNKIKQYININDTDQYNDYITYIRNWKKYIDTRFVENKPTKTRSIGNLMYRIKYYYMNFVKDGLKEIIGYSGYCAMIMAYDALLDCDGKWEKIIFYSILYPGDSDATGAIAGGLYGIMYKLGDVPKNMLCCIEKSDELIEIGKKFAKIKS